MFKFQLHRFVIWISREMQLTDPVQIEQYFNAFDVAKTGHVGMNRNHHVCQFFLLKVDSFKSAFSF